MDDDIKAFGGLLVVGAITLGVLSFFINSCEVAETQAREATARACIESGGVWVNYSCFPRPSCKGEP